MDLGWIAAQDLAKSFLSFALMMGLGITGNIDNLVVDDYGLRVQTEKSPGMSFGNIAFSNPRQGVDNYNHEYGHLIQEDIWGPVYLPITATGSLIGNVLSLLAPRKLGRVYYNIGTEKQADLLGGVDR